MAGHRGGHRLRAASKLCPHLFQKKIPDNPALKSSYTTSFRLQQAMGNFLSVSWSAWWRSFVLDPESFPARDGSCPWASELAGLDGRGFANGTTAGQLLGIPGILHFLGILPGDFVNME